MKLLFLKLYRGFFPNRFTEKKEQEASDKRIFLHSRTEIHPKLVSAMCFACFMPVYLSVKPHETTGSLNNTPASVTEMWQNTRSIPAGHMSSKKQI
jgi:hypothetical protein